MRIEYNPRKFLLLVPLPLLRQYFDSRGALAEMAWDDLKENEKGYETVYAAWQALPTRAREAIGADFLERRRSCDETGRSGHHRRGEVS